jgi:DNA mismatch repair protein MutL
VDIISLLPESLANQIAAGEVVQRPASVVKELLENSVDAGATRIQLIVKDAGKTLVQVTDNGKGMSENDARLCFERHATSKIKKADDLFAIFTKGFRGEALASIASIAQVEMYTRRHESPMGTITDIAGSKVKSHSPHACPEGTTFKVKNLFFNVPARRYFLKSDPVEFRHILDEFHRVALTHPEVHFELMHQDQEYLKLPVAPLRQRLVHVFGARYNEWLVPVEESTEIVNVSGYIGKTEAVKKTRGDQYLFVNHRFVKHAYIHHAVQNAFEALLPHGHHPFYCLYLDINPSEIDINIHPTKTEVKFLDERAIYAIVHAAVKRSIGKFQLSPSIDFNQENALPFVHIPSGEIPPPPQITVNPGYNPFENDKGYSSKPHVVENWMERKSSVHPSWESLYEIQRQATPEPLFPMQSVEMKFTQLLNGLILCDRGTDILIIHAQRAQERILHEAQKTSGTAAKVNAQLLLDHQTITVLPNDAALMEEIRDELIDAGYKWQTNDEKHTYLISIPAGMTPQEADLLLSGVLDELRQEQGLILTSVADKVRQKLSRSVPISSQKRFTPTEMEHLIQKLMQCTIPNKTPKGEVIFTRISHSEMEAMFQ